MYNNKGVLAIIEIDQQTVRDKVFCHPDIDKFNSGDCLPLHMMLKLKLDAFYRLSPVSEEANCFSLLIRHYPESAGIQDTSGCTLSDHATRLDVIDFDVSLANIEGREY